jgi:hypothetical protein
MNSLFAGPAVPDPIDISLEYLSLRKKEITTHGGGFQDFDAMALEARMHLSSSSFISSYFPSSSHIVV